MWRTISFVFVAPVRALETVLAILLLGGGLIVLSGQYMIVPVNGNTASAAVIVELDEVETPAPLASEPAPPIQSGQQMKRVILNMPFEEARAEYATVPGSAKQPADMKLASLPPVAAAPKAVVKPASKEAPKLKPVEVTPKVKLSSANWDQMSGPQRWQFVAGFIRSQHWICPPSGHTSEWEIRELEKHSWWTVLNFGFNNCTKQG